MEVRASSSDDAHDAMRAKKAPFRSGATASPSRHTNLNADAANLEARCSRCYKPRRRASHALVFSCTPSRRPRRPREPRRRRRPTTEVPSGAAAPPRRSRKVVVANCVSSSAARDFAVPVNQGREVAQAIARRRGAPSKNNPSRRSESSSSDLRKSAMAVAHFSEPRAMDASKRK